jgi:succinate-semialdehyde dehydrogenase / glutarate-semialdehyde dehydrogenase
MVMRSVNPATEELLASFEEYSPQQLEEALSKSEAAYAAWRRTAFSERADLTKKLARLLSANKAELAGLITAEMGKPIVEAESEVEKCVWNCDFYAENAERFLSPQAVITNATESYVAFEPLGTILAIMPWNFPFWQVFRFAAPTLMAGNTALLKHASNVPQCALKIEEVIRRAGFPGGVFQTLLVSSSTAQSLIEDERIRAVTLTGSDLAGSSIAAKAGRVLKKCVMELGGSDPFIVLADADLKAAAVDGARARNQNAGQSCIAAKRFIVVDEVADEFERLFVAAIASLNVGDPRDRRTQIGPLARSDLRDTLDSQVQRSISHGATLALGGSTQQGGGYFYNPTVLTQVEPEMAASCEETFGPLAAVIRARDTKEALAMANHSRFGLGAALWTQDITRARHLAREIESGSVFINGIVASDPRLPFGGVKRSGYGRELSEYGIREFVNIKTVWIGPAHGAARKPSSE